MIAPANLPATPGTFAPSAPIFRGRYPRQSFKFVQGVPDGPLHAWDTQPAPASNIIFRTHAGDEAIVGLGQISNGQVWGLMSTGTPPLTPANFNCTPAEAATWFVGMCAELRTKFGAEAWPWTAALRVGVEGGVDIFYEEEVPGGFGPLRAADIVVLPTGMLIDGIMPYGYGDPDIHPGAYPKRPIAARIGEMPAAFLVDNNEGGRDRDLPPYYYHEET